MPKFAAMLLSLGMLSSLGYSENSTQPGDTIILSKVTSGGFTPPQLYGWASELVIYDDGTVVERYRANGDAPWEINKIATLTEHVVAGLRETTSELSEGTLSFPDEPRCTDIPRTSYKGLNRENALVEFAANEACVSGHLLEFDDAERLKTIIDALDSLASAN